MRALWLFILISIAHTGNGQYVTIKGKQFYDRDGSRFFPKIMNYSISPGYNSFPVNSNSDMWVGPWPQYGQYRHLENPDGLDQIRQDFAAIRGLGFNSIRLITGLKRYNTPPCTTGQGSYCHPCNGVIGNSVFSFDWFLSGWNQNISLNAKNNKCYAIQAPYDLPSNPQMAIFLQMLEDVIEVADREDLRVILLTADGFDLFRGGFGQPNQTAVDDYKAFLKVMTGYLATNTAIMAYDLDNEPNYKDNDNDLWNRKKNEVCDFSGQLYDAIKEQSDTNHLITIGLGHAGTTRTWDPGVMKTDFVSLHIYPEPQWQYDYGVNIQEDVMQHAIDRMMDQIYWASTYLERPWILEETGFTSSDDSGSWDCGTFGDYSDLNAFMQDLLPIIRDCGPSGYAWWGFQDSFENGYTPPDCSLQVPPGQANLDHSRRSWAFLMSGDPDPTWGYNLLMKQPACSTLQTFPWTATAPCSINPPNTVTLSDHYYDPYLNHISNPGLTGAVTGTCRDSEGRPIAGAVIAAANYLYTEQDPSDGDIFHYYWTHTFSDSNGDYVLVPFNYHTPGLNEFITQVRVTAPGYKTVEEGTLQGQPVSANIQFTLPGATPKYASTVTQTVLSTETISEQAWARVNFEGTNEIYGSMTVRARESIEINEGFFAVNGCVFDAGIQAVWPDCNDYSGFRHSSHENSNELNYQENNNEIVLLVDSRSNSVTVRCFPNPATRQVSVVVPEYGPDMRYLLKLLSMEGQLILEEEMKNEMQILDLISIQAGAYLIRIETSDMNWCLPVYIVK